MNFGLNLKIHSLRPSSVGRKSPVNPALQRYNLLGFEIQMQEPGCEILPHDKSTLPHYTDAENTLDEFVASRT